MDFFKKVDKKDKKMYKKLQNCEANSGKSPRGAGRRSESRFEPLRRRNEGWCVAQDCCGTTLQKILSNTLL